MTHGGKFMKYLFKNAQIFSQGNIVFGDVAVEDNIIKQVGAITNFNADRIIDVNGNILMSGFVNAHCHTPSTVLRGICDDKPLAEWLDAIIPYEQKLSDADVYWSTMLGIAEYVSGGITCVEENYGNLKPIVKAYSTAKMRARIGIGYPYVNKVEKLSLDQQYDLIKNTGFSAVCYAHSVYGADEGKFSNLVTFAKMHNLPVATHLSETLKEVGDCIAKNGLTPPELLEDYGFLDRRNTLYHCVHCDKDDISLLASYNANIVTCPSSNLKLGSGVAPVYAMQNAGINIAIGTDGAYSNNSYDMFKEMFLVATLNKATLNKADILSSKEVVEMATKNGAKALGIDGIGDIKAGYFADIILINTNTAHTMPNNNFISNLVYATKSSDVYLTMINGKIVYENGIFDIGEDIQTIFEKNKKIIKKLKGDK